ncbi:MAG TPA: HD domain-containing protein [Candidatus Limnocylindria bacterium]|nr:HD domain-containing protein [Candidatus Limnocylindria bacterium]
MKLKNLNNILSFLHQAEKLKSVLRHSWLSSGRRESTAEHTWRMALMAMVLRDGLKKKPNLEKTLKMVLVHDLVEVYAGDIPAFKKDKSQKRKLELLAIVKITKNLPPKPKQEITSLWNEYGERRTLEAKFAKALDRLEVLMQHAEADIRFLNKTEFKFNLLHGVAECEFDPFLKSFRKKLSQDFIKIYKSKNVSPKLYK